MKFTQAANLINEPAVGAANLLITYIFFVN
jgi:hypothetical protein